MWLLYDLTKRLFYGLCWYGGVLQSELSCADVSVCCGLNNDMR